MAPKNQSSNVPPNQQISKETIPVKAIVVTDQAAGTAGMLRQAAEAA